MVIRGVLDPPDDRSCVYMRQTRPVSLIYLIPLVYRVSRAAADPGQCAEADNREKDDVGEADDRGRNHQAESSQRRRGPTAVFGRRAAGQHRQQPSPRGGREPCRPDR